MSDFRRLEVFAAVGHASSFTQAAVQLHVSQPVVSRTVRELERSLGVTLFARTTRSVELTAEGRELLAISDDLLLRREASLARFADFCRGDRGTIVIAALPSVAAAILPPLLAAFLASFPDIGVSIVDVGTAAAVREVELGRADFAIAEPPATGGFDVRVIQQDRFVAAVPDGHELARRSTVTWRQLARHPFVALGHGTSVRRLTDVAMARADITPSTIVETRNIATAGGLVAAGMGVTAFPELVLPLVHHAPLTFRPLTGPVMQRDIAIVTRSDGPPTPPAQRLIAELERNAAVPAGG